MLILKIKLYIPSINFRYTAILIHHHFFIQYSFIISQNFNFPQQHNNKNTCGYMSGATPTSYNYSILKSSHDSINIKQILIVTRRHVVVDFKLISGKCHSLNVGLLSNGSWSRKKRQLYKGQRLQIQNSFPLHTYAFWGTYLHRITDWVLTVTKY